MTKRDELLAIVQQLENCAIDLNSGEIGGVAEKLRTLTDSMTVPEDVAGLIETARAWDKFKLSGPVPPKIKWSEIATALEAQAEKIAKLERENERFRRMDGLHSPADLERLDAMAHADTLAAENARLREALAKIRDRFNWAEHNGSLEWTTHNEAIAALQENKT